MANFPYTLIPTLDNGYTWAGCYDHCNKPACVPPLCDLGRKFTVTQPSPDPPLEVRIGHGTKQRFLDEYEKLASSILHDCDDAFSGFNRSCYCRPGDYWPGSSRGDVISFTVLPSGGSGGFGDNAPIVVLYPHGGDVWSSLPNVGSGATNWKGAGLRLQGDTLTGHIRVPAGVTSSDNMPVAFFEPGEYFWPVHVHDGDGYFRYDPIASELTKPPVRAEWKALGQQAMQTCANAQSGANNTHWMPAACGVWLYARKLVTLSCGDYETTWSPVEFWRDASGAEAGDADLRRLFYDGPDYPGLPGLHAHCWTHLSEPVRWYVQGPGQGAACTWFLEDRGGVCTIVGKAYRPNNYGFRCPGGCWLSYVQPWSVEDGCGTPEDNGLVFTGSGGFGSWHPAFMLSPSYQAGCTNTNQVTGLHASLSTLVSSGTTLGGQTYKTHGCGAIVRCDGTQIL